MSKLFKNISIYSTGNLIGACVSFLLLPLYTRLLSPGDYGELELLYTLAIILSILFGLIISNGYTRIYYENKDAEYRKRLFFTGQIFTLICAIVFSGILIGNVNWVSSSALNSKIDNLPIILITLSTVIEVMSKIPLSNIRNRELPKKYIIVQLTGLLFTVISTIIFVALLRYGVMGVLYGRLIGESLKFIVASIFTRTEFGMKFSASQLWLMLAFSVFLLPSNLSSIILNMSNRYFLQEYQTMGDVGLYALGAKLAAIIPMLFIEPIKQAFCPHFFAKLSNPHECKDVLASFSRLFFISLSVVVLVVSLFSREAVMIIADKSFSGSSDVTFLLSMSNLILGLAAIVVLGIHAVRKTWIVTVIWMFSSIINICLNIYLIPIYGRMGAAFATLISIAVICVCYFIAVRIVFKTKFDYFSFVKVCFLTTGFYYIGTLCEFGILTSLLLKSVIILIYVAALFIFGVVKKEEFVRLINIVRKKIPFKRSQLIKLENSCDERNSAL